MTKSKIFIIIIAVCFAVVLIWMIIFPYRWKSTERIRADILKMTPIGTDADDVLIIVKNKKRWELNTVNQGYIKKEYGSDHRPIYITVGVKSMGIHLDSYFAPPLAGADVGASWVFDEDDKLIDVFVSREFDSL